MAVFVSHFGKRSGLPLPKLDDLVNRKHISLGLPPPRLNRFNGFTFTSEGNPPPKEK